MCSHLNNLQATKGGGPASRGASSRRVPAPPSRMPGFRGPRRLQLAARPPRSGQQGRHLRGLGPGPPHPQGKRGGGGRRPFLTLRRPVSALPSPRTRTESPGLLEKLLLLAPAPHPGARSTHAPAPPAPEGPGPEPPGAGSRCRGRAGPVRRPSPFPATPRIASRPSARGAGGARILRGAPPPRGLGAGDLRERARHRLGPAGGARALGECPGLKPGALALRQASP